MSRILLVEDDPVLGRGISVTLELEGFRVSWVRNLRAAHLARQETPPELVILDLGLPDGNGLEFCAAMREQSPDVPILILTAKIDEDSVVEGLNAGASDYIRKPFGNRELLARIRTALRESQSRELLLRYGGLVIMTGQRKVLAEPSGSPGAPGLRDSPALNGEPRELQLNRREFDILKYLVHHAERVVTRENLLNTLDREGEMIDRTVDSHLSHLRSKLRHAGVGSLRIASVYGIGYRLEKVASGRLAE